MRSLYSNPNARFRRVHTERVVRPIEVSAADAKVQEITKAELERSARKTPRDKHFSKGHVLNVVRAMPHIRSCRQHMRRPRNVPRKVLETVVMFQLI